MGRENHSYHMQSGCLVSHFSLGSHMSSPRHPGSSVQLSAAPASSSGQDHIEALVPVFRPNLGQPLASSRLSSKWAVKWLVQVPTAGIWPNKLALSTEQCDADSRLKLLARPWESGQGFRWTKASGPQPHPTKKYLYLDLCTPILYEQLKAETRRILLTVGVLVRSWLDSGNPLFY